MELINTDFGIGSGCDYRLQEYLALISLMRRHQQVGFAMGKTARRLPNHAAWWREGGASGRATTDNLGHRARLPESRTEAFSDSGWLQNVERDPNGGR